MRSLYIGLSLCPCQDLLPRLRLPSPCSSLQGLHVMATCLEPLILCLVCTTRVVGQGLLCGCCRLSATHMCMSWHEQAVVQKHSRYLCQRSAWCPDPSCDVWMRLDQSAPKLLQLPANVWVAILERCSKRDRLAFASVCHQTRRTVLACASCVGIISENEPRPTFRSILVASLSQPTPRALKLQGASAVYMLLERPQLASSAKELTLVGSGSISLCNLAEISLAVASSGLP
jgi:hypothetical protein